MNATLPMKEWAVKAKTTAFGNYIDPERKLVDLPNMVLVEVDVPEYERNGLGRMVAKTLRYDFTDIGQIGCEAMSIGADGSRAHMIYEDMQPTVLGTFAEVEAKSPAIAKVLFQRRYGPEMVALGVLRGVAMNINPESPEDVAKLVAFLNKYHRRASWMEAHNMEVRMANMEALVGNPAPFDWVRIFPDVETGEL
ncbi:hypothetical protein [uncultured Zoogloea sp.]|uniref:hypothetical protein n=1 Tax=uncultured Zoogloea sp. TaxID=160237 RepID=UPI002632A293|nr:hypothetical protein [uncultured Zoogloea sp.]